MGRNAPQQRRPGETDADYADRLAAQQRLTDQAWREVAYAAAAKGLSLAEVTRRMGNKSPATLNNRDGITLARLANIGLAIGVEFKVTYVNSTTKGDR